jgi:hypothetical protein
VTVYLPQTACDTQETHKQMKNEKHFPPDSYMIKKEKNVHLTPIQATDQTPIRFIL